MEADSFPEPSSRRSVFSAAAIKILAERRMGELLAGTERDIGGRPSKTSTQRELVSKSPTLAALGVTKKESARAQLLAAIPRRA